MTQETFRQDMPPPGGYPKFNFARTYAKSLYKPKIVLPLLVGCGVYGYFQGKMQIQQIITAKFEDTDLQNAMEPFLWAERDRYWLKLLKRNRDYENELMKNVPGWQTGTWYGEPVFFTLGDKWWDPPFHEVVAHAPKRTENWEITWKHHSEYAGPKFYDAYLPNFIKNYIR